VFRIQALRQKLTSLYQMQLLSLEGSLDTLVRRHWNTGRIFTDQCGYWSRGIQHLSDGAAVGAGLVYRERSDDGFRRTGPMATSGVVPASGPWAWALIGFCKKPAQPWAYPWACMGLSPNAVVVRESPGSQILVDCM